MSLTVPLLITRLKLKTNPKGVNNMDLSNFDQTAFQKYIDNRLKQSITIANPSTKITGFDLVLSQIPPLERVTYRLRDDYPKLINGVTKKDLLKIFQQLNLTDYYMHHGYKVHQVNNPQPYIILTDQKVGVIHG